MASNDDNRQFLFDSFCVDMPNEQKPELIEILKQRYKNLLNKEIKDAHV
jgi:hypothetical protein